MSHIATKRQFSRNLVSGWMLLVMEVAIAFVLTPFIITQLGVAAYGIWSLMVGVIGYMGLIDIGIRGSVGRYINHYMALKDERAVSEVVGTANVVLTALGAVILLASFVVAANFSLIFPKTPPELAGDILFCLPLMALGLWLAFVSSIQSNLLAAREAAYLTNNYNVVLLLLRAGSTVAVLMAGWGMRGLMLVSIGVALIGLGLLLWTVRREFGAAMPRMAAFSGARLQEMWRYGVASFVSRTASTMANDSAPLIGMWLLGPEAVAVYSVAMTLTQYTRRLIDQANTAIFPSVMKAGAMKDLPGLRGLYLRFMDMSFAIGSLVFIGMMVFSQSFLGLWVGEAYEAGAVVAGILSFGYLMQSVASTAPLTLAAMDRIGTTVKIGIGEALGCLALTAALPGLFGWGLAGMALGATLPRLFSNWVLYPRLALQSMGSELKFDMLRRLGWNLLMCLGVAAAFLAVHEAIPSDTWPGLVAAVIVVTVLHVFTLGGRYQVFPALERFNASLHGALRRWMPGRGG
jgi:O-antigen/teichoic acid export membrane protein